MFEFGASDNELFAACLHGLGAAELPQARIVNLSIDPEQVVGLARAAGICQLGAGAGGS